MADRHRILPPKRGVAQLGRARRLGRRGRRFKSCHPDWRRVAIASAVALAAYKPAQSSTVTLQFEPSRLQRYPLRNVILDARARLASPRDVLGPCACRGCELPRDESGHRLLRLGLVLGASSGRLDPRRRNPGSRRTGRDTLLTVRMPASVGERSACAEGKSFDEDKMVRR